LKKDFFVYVVLSILIVSSIDFCIVNTSSGENILTITTGEIDLTGGIKVKASYDVPIWIHHQETMVPEEEVEWAFSVATGEIDLQIYVPSPLNQWFSVTKKPLPIGLGTDIDIPVPIPGARIKARIKTQLTASLSLNGPGILNTNTLTWSSDGSQVFSIKASSGSEGNQIQVVISGNIGVSISLVINIIGLFEHEIELENLGFFDFQPFTHSIDVVPDWRILQEQINTLQTQKATLQNDYNSLQQDYNTLLNSPPYNTVNILIITNIATVLIVVIIYFIKK
jgi:hypothetical protein